MTEQELNEQINEHRKAGDLWEFLLKNLNEVIPHCFSSDIKAFDREVWKISCNKEISFLRDLYTEHRKNNNLEMWFQELRKDEPHLMDDIVHRIFEIGVLEKIYQKEISEHRNAGDLRDYFFEIILRGELRFLEMYGDCGHDQPERKIIAELLTNKELKELKPLWFIAEDLQVRNQKYRSICWHMYGVRKYIYNLSKKKPDSADYKLYLKIREKTKKKKEFDSQLKRQKFTNIGIIAGISLVLILIGAFSINRVVTKDARMAKKEAQQIEKVKVKKTKDLQKAQAYDQQQLEKIGAKKINPLDLLVYTSEPKLYVIAPMTYDTKEFIENNSHEKGMFGSEKDYSVERLAILEGCITDFNHKIDGLTGVSFLDRTKIAQIEKEHKFQLGDWSNDKKTAEVGRALNANILLFLDKFAYIDSDYRFEAKFVDINTMQSSSFNIVYKNPKKKIVTPENVGRISFRDFTAIPTKNTSFEDELSLKTQNKIRTVQKNDLKQVSPLGNVTKLETSEYDVNVPKTDFMQVSAINIDGLGGIEVNMAESSATYTYTFEPCELYIERIGNDFYTDGRIGTLTIKTESGYEKFDVFTVNKREYFIRLGTAELPKVTVNYYLQMVKN